MLLAVFTISMFVSAALLFLVEPMLAKMALPLLGGTPAVWNTCLVFFQTVLLAGYIYAYASTKWLGRRAQIALHLCLALTPLAVLPLHIPAGWEPPTQGTPVLWVLAMLSVAVGLPFFVLSSSTPMLQRWFSQSGDKAAHDPYFLYAASNAGSMVGLLGYPFLLEPTLRLSMQSRAWSLGYGLFVILTAVCALLVWKAKPSANPSAYEPSQPEIATSWRQRLLWIILAFVPSSLTIGVTTQLTTDIPSIPLFWVLPLALYLLSFVLVFARHPPIPHAWVIRRLPLLLLLALIPTVCKTKLPLLALIAIYLSALFAVALFCHGELARSRPNVSRLTEFYLWMSFGGVLGGVFNALLAPVLFSSVVEFPIVLVIAALLRPAIVSQEENPAEAVRACRNDWLLPIALGLTMATVIVGLEHSGMRPGRPMVVLIFGYSMLWCMSFSKRPLRFAGGLVALLVAGTLYTGPFGTILHTERSFFGVSRVTNDPTTKLRNLFHGGTSHGIQNLDPALSREPLAYYTTSGPVGSIFHALYTSSSNTRPQWAVVGLGAGAMACYVRTGDSLTYYEIDPTVKRIASDPRYFTFLSQCAPETRIVLGDARLELRDAPDASYDLIVLDAFSGDTIPMHLMTKEALALYRRKLKPGGMLAFHITNLYLNLEPTLGELAHDAGLVCLSDDDRSVSQAQIDAGRLPSHWLVMARTASDLGPLATDSRWAPATVPTGTQLWTDDYSNLLHVIRWDSLN